MKLQSIIFLIFICTIQLQGQEVNHEYLNTNLPFEERVDILLEQMTLEEKVSQMLNESSEIGRLGIPAYNWWNECLHGLARSGFATVFPQSITVAASFDKELMLKIGSIISDEARAKHHDFVKRGMRGMYMGLDFWSPNINIFRDPRWGRGHETYGEDPFLTGELATNFIKGLQGEDPKYFKTIATSKHFAVHSGPEALRHGFDVDVSDVDLYETYLPAFKKTVQEGNVYSVMGAYNRFRGESCSGHDDLLNNILRKEWGFDGYVVSDCGAINDIMTGHHLATTLEEAAAIGVKGGCDLNCGTTYEKLTNAVKKGLITENEIDISLKRILLARFKLGMFDGEEEVPFTQIPREIVCCHYHNSIALEAARKSIVLLKNEDNFLPLSKNKIKKIAVIGPNADNWEALLGNYHGIPKNPVTVLHGVKNKVEPACEVFYHEGVVMAEGIHNLVPIPSIYLQTVDGKQGLKGEYFDNAEFLGQPAFTKIDNQIDFTWDHKPLSKNVKDTFSIRWTGYIFAPESGTYNIGAWAKFKGRIYLNDELFIGTGNQHHAFHNEKPVEMVAGEKYKIVYEFSNPGKDAQAKLLWSMPEENRLEKAVEVAREADVAVLVLGLSQRVEGEEMPISIDGFDRGDRTKISLPEKQRQLLKAVKALGKPVILVLNAGSAVAVNWAQDNVDAILHIGYPGEEGGTAVADVLFGDYNPAGRLPVTFYKSVDQLPPFENYDMAGRTYRYFSDEPLYPFGYGLSYTKFEYSDLQIPENINAGEPVRVSVTVKNAGNYNGDEVVQIYISDEKGSTPRPIHQLSEFKRIHLKSGESKKLEFTLDPYLFSMINNKSERVIEPGWFTISVGGKQPGFTGYQDVETTGVVSQRLRIIGDLTFDIK
ncbi:glycoside hydrolase family 3 C-terminal domain-containing protein [uncultured Draconibacterium sp.]|uniref:glycoside hydrolase family 3 C-terminal domain-containing protein n=1 Tax=uncultured Draconibacterium sp. TaxID=1573823 RepID=UPI002AA95259|nr:glycoside hydrolase family 3 C-terminal domain-containing protein [uncultured Draconibacterium sp.]